MKRVNGLRALIHDTVKATVDLVEQSHESVARKPVELLGQVPGIGEGARAAGLLQEGIAKAVYESIRLINRGIDLAGDAAVTAAERAGVGQLVAERAALSVDQATAKELSYWVDSAQSALNAWVGDFLAERDNGLAIPMGFFVAGKPVACTRDAFAEALPQATPKLCILVHGLGCTDASWNFRASEQHGDPDANYGTFLARDLGYTPLYVRYNTGLHISENARALAELLESLRGVYPVPLQEIALVGHSMGGLVVRGAAHYARLSERSWIEQLTHVLCIGSPHLGAPLEKAANWFSHFLARFDTPGTQIPAQLINMRSAGIKDLRFGYILDEDWTDKDPDACLKDERNDVPLVSTVTYGFIAASFHHDPEHPLGELLGDLLVRVGSASGRHPEPARHVRFDIGEVVHGVHHIAMLNHPKVYEQVRRFLSNRVLEVFGEAVSEPVASLAADFPREPA